MSEKLAQPGDPYWIVMGDSPPVLVESGVIGPNGERLRDPQPYWRKPKRDWSLAGWFRALWARR
jgi:hypothetical protein